LKPTGGLTAVSDLTAEIEACFGYASAERIRLCQNSKNRNDTAIYSVIKPYNKENNAIYGATMTFDTGWHVNPLARVAEKHFCEAKIFGAQGAWARRLRLADDVWKQPPLPE
jgi:hypothetical protein